MSVDPNAPPYPITAATYASINKLLGQANIGWLRVDFDWGGSLVGDGTLDTTAIKWGAMDVAVNNALCSGLNILGNLSYSPAGAVNRTVGYPSERYKYLPDDMNTWAAFVRAVVNHYPQIRYWSIWNEPDGFGYFRGYGSETSPNQLVSAYNALVQYAAPGIRGNYDGQGRRYLVAPEVSDAGGLAATVPWVKGVLAGQGQNIDVVAVHHYGFSRDGSDVSNYAQSMAQQIQGTPIQAGGSWTGDVWLTEAGVSGCNEGVDYYKRLSSPLNVYCTGANHSYIDDNFQANQLTGLMQAMRGAAGSRWTKTFYWHADKEVIADSVGDDTGILHGARANALVGRPAFTIYSGIGGGGYGSNQNVSVTATPAVASSYYYVWEYQWCYNGNASGDCDHLWHPYASGSMSTVSPYVYKQDFYVYVRVWQYAWQNGPQLGSGQWTIRGDGTCTDPRGGGGGSGGGGLSSPNPGAVDTTKTSHSTTQDPSAERMKGIGHARNH